MVRRPKKNARLDLRLSTESKELLQEASILSGLDLSSFTLSAALEKANEVLVKRENRVLSRKQSEHFLELLEREEPTQKLVGAAKRYKALSND